MHTQRSRSPAGLLRIRATPPHHSPPRVSRSSPAPSVPNTLGRGALGSGRSSWQPGPAGSPLPARPRPLTPAGTLRMWFVARGVGDASAGGQKAVCLLSPGPWRPGPGPTSGPAEAPGTGSGHADPNSSCWEEAEVGGGSWARPLLVARDSLGSKPGLRLPESGTQDAADPYLVTPPPAGC